jgi:heptosyltransferase II
MIGVIQTSFVGDCVLTLPFLAELAQKEVDQEIVLITQAGIQKDIFELARQRGLAQWSSRIRIEVLDKKNEQKSLLATWRWSQKKIQTQDPFKTVYCIHRSFRSAFVAWALGAEDRVGFSSGAASFLYTRAVKRSWEHGVHEIEKNFDLLRSSYSDQKIETWLGLDKPSFLAQGAARPARAQDRVSLALGSPWPSKRWPVEHQIDLVKSLTGDGVEVYLLGDPQAKEIADQIVAAVPSLLVKNFVGKTGAQEWVDLIDSSALLISGDSASVHVASDLGVPVIALFGPTIPDFGFAPWRSHSKVLQVEHLPCRPCHIHGPKVCPLGHHKCLKSIGSEQVLRHLKPYLSVDP